MSLRANGIRNARRIAFLISLPLLALPWLSPSSTADLSSSHTDHLRHAYAVRVFWARGLDLYRLPFGEAARGVAGRHPGLYWEHVPYAYPPGALLLFLPVSAASEAWVEAHLTHARWLVTFTTGLALLAWFALLCLLFSGAQTRVELAVAAMFAAFAFPALMRAGLEGFYDPAWFAVGVAAIIALQRKSFEAALGLCALAVSIHLRAAALAPVAGMAFFGLLQTRGRRAWLHPAVLFAAVVGVIAVYVFTAADRFAPEFRGGKLALYSQPLPLVICTAVTVGAAGLCLWRRKPLAAAALFVVWGLALGDLRAWWHASMALIPLLLFFCRGANGQPLGRTDGWVAIALVVWAVQFQRFAWGGRAWDLLPAIGGVLRPLVQ